MQLVSMKQPDISSWDSGDHMSDGDVALTCAACQHTGLEQKLKCAPKRARNCFCRNSNMSKVTYGACTEPPEMKKPETLPWSVCVKATKS